MPRYFGLIFSVEKRNWLRSVDLFGLEALQG